MDVDYEIEEEIKISREARDVKFNRSFNKSLEQSIDKPKQ